MFKYKNLCDYKDNYAFINSIDKKFLNKKTIEKNINNHKDIIGRKDIFVKEDINKNYPKYILNNLRKFNDWII